MHASPMWPATSCLHDDEIPTRRCHHHHGITTAPPSRHMPHQCIPRPSQHGNALHHRTSPQCGVGAMHASPMWLTTSCLRGDVITTVRLSPTVGRHHQGRAATNVTPPPRCGCRLSRAGGTNAPHHHGTLRTVVRAAAPLHTLHQCSVRAYGARWATHGGCRNTRPIVVCEADSRENTPTGNRFRRWHIVRGARFQRFCNNFCNVRLRQCNASPRSNALP